VGRTTFIRSPPKSGVWGEHSQGAERLGGGIREDQELGQGEARTLPSP